VLSSKSSFLLLATGWFFLAIMARSAIASDSSIGTSQDLLLLESCEKGDMDQVTRLLKDGANANASREGDGSAALILASNKGHVHIAEKLIAAGAQVNAKNRNGWTALMGAASNGHLSVVALLVAGQADVNARHSYGWTALKLASQKGHKQVRDLLLKSGAKE
jgi:uncharacterized protein